MGCPFNPIAIARSEAEFITLKEQGMNILPPKPANIAAAEVECKEAMHKNTILCGWRGSYVHGLLVDGPDSIDDFDFMSIFTAPRDHYIGINQIKETNEIMRDTGLDLVEYEIRKILVLLMRGNPNVLSLLWLKPEHYIFKTAWGQHLIDKRNLFSTLAAYDSFCGYAMGQIKKASAKSNRGWRGDKRKELFEKFGYDTKNAAHCIRLLRMGREFIETGILNVDRTEIDRDEILDIKLGKYSLDYVSDLANREAAKLEYSKGNSKLSALPINGDVNDLCQSLLRANMNLNGSAEFVTSSKSKD